MYWQTRHLTLLEEGSIGFSQSRHRSPFRARFSPRTSRQVRYLAGSAPSTVDHSLEGSFTSACVPHGMRTSFRTWAAECSDVPREIAGHALAHDALGGGRVAIDALGRGTHALGGLGLDDRGYFDPGEPSTFDGQFFNMPPRSGAGLGLRTVRGKADGAGGLGTPGWRRLRRGVRRQGTLLEA